MTTPSGPAGSGSRNMRSSAKRTASNAAVGGQPPAKKQHGNANFESSSSGDSDDDNDNAEEHQPIFDQVDLSDACRRPPDSTTAFGVDVSKENLALMSQAPPSPPPRIANRSGTFGWRFQAPGEYTVPPLFAFTGGTKPQLLAALSDVTGVDTAAGGANKDGKWSAKEIEGAVGRIMEVRSPNLSPNLSHQ